mmetsp:Transcript_8792/g.7859  ORF Transcript_8792/g.7859 Transcript_8792/m.7859 type:complete len:412 (-) Transcript_8792:14-1249(-)
MTRWTVIGGGPCGIASVGRLVDLGYHVNWIDSSFTTGRLGKYYRNIPANTPINDLIYALKLCKSFQFEKHQDIRKSKGIKTISDGLIDKSIVHLPIDSNESIDNLGSYCMDLKYFCEALDDITNVLLENILVQSYRGIVTRIDQSNDWNIKITSNNNEEINLSTDAVILTCGSIPINSIANNISDIVNKKVEIHSLDNVVDSNKVSSYINNNNKSLNEVWCVVGSSHSAMLILKNLIDNNINNIVNIYKSPFRYQHYKEDEVVYPGIGLKGPVGEWTKNKFIHLNNINRIKYDENVSWDEYIEKYNIDHLIFAIGFQTNTLSNQSNYIINLDEPFFPIISINNQIVEYNKLNQYDILTGEINNYGSLFGGGIAYPQYHMYSNNTSEPWIGFKRSIEQIDLMIAVFNNKNRV